ncbi:hypothetical protein GWK47_036979 [Chionoecetes opilio]|uniref:Uncharacterized protein n=1 Tax=Chionoecetes opilio TaxID=41210 RepID=A0A8J4YFE9_CHIOP|nr:hypothetical protein GWK47_036979 [Chionoecetes opilio]
MMTISQTSLPQDSQQKQYPSSKCGYNRGDLISFIQEANSEKMNSSPSGRRHHHHHHQNHQQPTTNHHPFGHRGGVSHHLPPGPHYYHITNHDPPPWPGVSFLASFCASFGLASTTWPFQEAVKKSVTL